MKAILQTMHNKALIVMIACCLFSLAGYAKEKLLTQASPSSDVAGNKLYFGELPQNIAYLTSWQLPENTADMLNAAEVDAYILAFAKWSEDGEISSSNGVVDIPQSSAQNLEEAYLTWTRKSHHSNKSKFLISFGGQEFDDIWTNNIFLERPEQLATSLAKLLYKRFPVYDRPTCATTINCDSKSKDNLKIIGYVELDGIDFDFEHRNRLNSQQNESMITLAKTLRSLVGKNKIIALTSYHVGADPIDCKNSNVFSNCSFTESGRSVHHGEALEALMATSPIVDFYNVMAYDAGKTFDYKTAMQNYAKAIGSPSRLRLGISINKQWSSDGGFLMPLEHSQERTKWQANAGYGGFFIWALGANTELKSIPEQVEQFNALKRASREH